VRQTIVHDCALKVSIPNLDVPALFVPALFVRLRCTPAYTDLYQTYHTPRMGKGRSKDVEMPLSGLTLKVKDKGLSKQVGS